MTLDSDARRIFRAGVLAVDPARAVRANLRRQRGGLLAGTRRLSTGPGGTLRLVAVGKAAGAMLDAAVTVAGRPCEGIAITPHGFPRGHSNRPVYFGEHPVPGAGSFRAGRRMLEFVARSHPSDALLFLVSGGGSAVAEVPSGRLQESDLARTTELLLGSGAPIGAMNAVRRHLSRTKGGLLAAAAPSGRFATLALSDVVGDAPEDIASGPTVPDPSTFGDALRVVRRYRLADRLPARVLRHLREGARGRVPETPKPGDRRFRSAPFVLVGSNRLALRAAALEASRRGYRTDVVDRPVTGETRPAAERFARRLTSSRARGPYALLAGGETTVTLSARPGRGGRNQEFVLAAAQVLAGTPTLILSAGTDGVDGPTDAAGGWIDGSTCERAVRLGVDIPRALVGHDAYPALERLGSLLKTGPTGTNVMDLHVGLVGPTTRRGRAGSNSRGEAPTSRRRRS
jgi:glycerate 2-kinase